MTKKNSERIDAILRIPLGIIGYIIMYFWGALIGFLALFNFFYTLITGKRNKTVSEFSNVYFGFLYSYIRYMFFITNERVFPFEKLKKPIEKVDMKK